MIPIKRRKYELILIGLLFLVLGACDSTEPVDPAYLGQIEEWHARRVENLTRPHGWLSLAGLFWLQEGKNTFGTHPDNDIVFPAGTCPDFLGTFYLANNGIRMQVSSEATVYLADSSQVENIQLVSDADGEPTRLFHKSLSWYIIKRGDRYGVRLRDSEHPNRKNFHGIKRYSVDPAWCLQAKFEAYDPVKKIKITNVLGNLSEQDCPGALAFTVKGEEYHLDVLDEGENEPFFVIVADETSGEETYGGGRFLYVDRPDADNTTVLDFNKAYNPPCAFTPYATCPLPPAQNRLPIAITAGEKRYEGEAGH